jgi:hypothetical protein
MSLRGSPPLGAATSGVDRGARSTGGACSPTRVARRVLGFSCEAGAQRRFVSCKPREMSRAQRGLIGAAFCCGASRRQQQCSLRLLD